MARTALRIAVTKKDQKDLEKLLSGGIQPVRVVLRAMALLQLGKGVSAPKIAAVVPLTPQAIRKVGHRYQEAGLERALHEKERPGAAALLEDSQRQRIIDGLRRAAGRPCPVDRAIDNRRSRKAQAGSAGGKGNSPSSPAAPRPQAVAEKMWCVAELNEDL
jgi:transposase